MSVPAFGDWDMKNGVPDYSMDFSKIRENRKQNKSDFFRASLGNEEELLANRKPVDGRDRRRDDYAQLSENSSETAAAAHSPSARKKIASYFVCCIGA
ncbi:uncharacterized protein A4U43_UnF8160 [Asparagus officinalis]|uniref:RIN4 pathogenic type III effector avirulence factor Avr cleavage site domain-containing protein n=2 Tax=Asparagus officinalis TaxID=4686 RepID=A0A1R3L605_ASPOF|nr:uncharacterized protein A4U43_UnF8160 [Asparagus officinalis]